MNNSKYRSAIFILIVTLFFRCSFSEDDIDLSSFELAEGLKIELVAKEPYIADPVDIAIDDVAVKDYAREVLEGNESVKMDIEDYDDVLSISWISSNGQSIFTRICSECH